MACGFVDVVVDGHAEVEGLERLVDASALRHGEHGIARHQHHGADLTLARREDLIGQRARRELRRDLGDPAHARTPAVIAGQVGGERADARQVEGGLREHPSADLVQSPGEDVEHVDEPVGSGAELGLAHAEPRIDRAAPRRREVAGQAADRLGRHTGAHFRHLGRDLPHHVGHDTEAVHERLGTPRSRKALLDEDVRHRGEQEDIGPRTDEDVLISRVRGLGAAGVHHDQSSAPLAQLLEPPLDVGRRHDRSIGDERIATHHEEEVRAVDVGHRQQERRPEEQVREEMLRLLVDTGGRVAIARPDRREKLRDVDDRRPAMRDGVAEVEADRVAAVTLAHVEQPLRDEVEGLVPSHLDPLVAHPPHGPAQTVRVMREVLQGHTLGAQISLAEGVGSVTADLDDPVVLDRDLQAAGRLAEIAGAVMDRHGTPQGGCP